MSADVEKLSSRKKESGNKGRGGSSFSHGIFARLFFHSPMCASCYPSYKSPASEP